MPLAAETVRFGRLENALFPDDGVEGRLPIADRGRVIRLVEVLGQPIAGHDTGELPAQPADHVRVRIILDRVDKRSIGRQVLAEPVLAVRVEHQLARQFGVI